MLSWDKIILNDLTQLLIQSLIKNSHIWLERLGKSLFCGFDLACLGLGVNKENLSNTLCEMTTPLWDC